MPIFRPLLAAGFAVVASVAAQSALAATSQSCALGAPDPSGRVTGTTDCEYIADMANSSDYGDVFFGGGFIEVERHEFVLRDEEHLSIVGGASAGIFGISPDILAAWDSLILVFKSGSGDNTNPGEAVAYVLGDVLSGDWLSPFTRTTGKCDGTAYEMGSGDRATDCTRQVSHIALLVRDESDDIPQAPLPAGLPLLLTAGAVAWGVRRNAARQAAQA